MRVAIADPPYVGQAKLYRHHPDYAGEVDHEALIQRLLADFPDGWALCCAPPTLRYLLPMCPPETRVMAWVKPFASFKPNINPAYAWEAVLVCGGICRTYREGGFTVRDWVSAPMTMGKGIVGVKPEAFCFWLFAVLGLKSGDEMVDLFPGSGAITQAWTRYQQQLEPQPSVSAQAAF